MKSAIDETERRRALQGAYNAEHNITPESIVRHIDEVFSSVYERDYSTPALRDAKEPFGRRRMRKSRGSSAEMKSAAANLDFERAASVRDRLKTLRSRDLGLTGSVLGH